MPIQLAEWVATPALSPFWSRVRERLEGNGLQAHGRLTVSVASREERHALSALLGVLVTRDRVAVDLAALDDRLAVRSGLGSLIDVVATITGSPLRDRAGERTRRARFREEPLDLARTLLEGPWVEGWIAGLRRTGLLTGRPDASRIVADAATVIGELLGSELVTQSRVELGARLLGDAHALDEDRLVSQVVLRGLAAASGLQAPTSSSARRALWGRYAVSPDLVSATCLVLGIRPEGSDGVSVRLRVSAESGDPVHLTAWDLRRWLSGIRVLPAQVLVCENPRVLEAVAERRGGEAAVVCTSGEPNTVVTAALQRLGASGCRLLYHGDFDWPGVSIANRLVHKLGVEPWLMTAGDYEAGLRERGLALTGSPVDPVWDAELGASMREHRVAVHEEALLDQIVDRITSPG